MRSSNSRNLAWVDCSRTCRSALVARSLIACSRARKPALLVCCLRASKSALVCCPRSFQVRLGLLSKSFQVRLGLLSKSFQVRPCSRRRRGPRQPSQSGSRLALRQTPHPSMLLRPCACQRSCLFTFNACPNLTESPAKDRIAAGTLHCNRVCPLYSPLWKHVSPPGALHQNEHYRDSRINLMAVRSPFATVTSMNAGMQTRSIPLGAR